MKVQSSENKLVITEEFIFDQNKLPSDPNNHFNFDCGITSSNFENTGHIASGVGSPLKNIN